MFRWLAGMVLIKGMVQLLCWEGWGVWIMEKVVVLYEVRVWEIWRG